MMETMPEMKARHDREKYEAYQSLNEAGYTQTQAALMLNMNLPALFNAVTLRGIVWKNIRQGKKTENLS